MRRPISWVPIAGQRAGLSTLNLLSPRGRRGAVDPRLPVSDHLPRADRLAHRARDLGSALVELDTTKAVLASRLGTIAETLSRTLAKMQRRGAIRVRGRKITLTDPAELQALAAGLKL